MFGLRFAYNKSQLRRLLYKIPFTEPRSAREYVSLSQYKPNTSSSESQKTRAAHGNTEAQTRSRRKLLQQKPRQSHPATSPTAPHTPPAAKTTRGSAEHKHTPRAGFTFVTKLKAAEEKAMNALPWQSRRRGALGAGQLRAPCPGAVACGGTEPGPRAPASASLRAAPSPGARSQPNRPPRQRQARSTDPLSLALPFSGVPLPDNVLTPAVKGRWQGQGRAPHATCPRSARQEPKHTQNKTQPDTQARGAGNRP